MKLHSGTDPDFKIRRARDRFIYEFRRSKYKPTLRQIGDCVGLSRERTRQLIVRYERRHGTVVC